MAPRLSGQIFKVSFVFQFPKDLDTKKQTPNIEVCPESLGAMLEYWYLERALLNHRSCRDLMNAYLYLIRYVIRYSISVTA